MGRVDDHALHCRNLDPPSGCPPAGEDQRIDAALFDDGKLKIAVERRCRDRFPIWLATHC